VAKCPINKKSTDYCVITSQKLLSFLGRHDILNVDISRHYYYVIFVIQHGLYILRLLAIKFAVKIYRRKPHDRANNPSLNNKSLYIYYVFADI
jgi:hypothetical protein